MRGLIALSACAFAAVAAPFDADAALDVRLAVKPASPRAGAEAVIELRTYRRADGRLKVADPVGFVFRVHAVSLGGRIARVPVIRVRRGLWRGVFRFDRARRWIVRVANFAKLPGLPVEVRPAVTTQSPAGFGPLGLPGCGPPSPRNRAAGQTFPARGEALGTALGGQLWALFFNGEWASSDSAVLAGVVGKQVKIVFRMTGAGAFDIAAIGPDAARVEPVSGPTFHPSSTWTRPGLEWGTVWILPQPGCWQIHAKHGIVTGDVWVLVKS
jgi:hypothetical protein